MNSVFQMKSRSSKASLLAKVNKFKIIQKQLKKWIYHRKAPSLNFAQTYFNLK